MILWGDGRTTRGRNDGYRLSGRELASGPRSNFLLRRRLAPRQELASSACRADGTSSTLSVLVPYRSIEQAVDKVTSELKDLVDKNTE